MARCKIFGMQNRWRQKPDIWQRAKKLFHRCLEDHIFNHAAALSFFWFLSIFPLLLLLLNLLAWIPVSNLDRFLIQTFHSALPSGSAALLENYIARFAQVSGRGGFSLTLLGAIWTASSAFAALIESVHLIDRKEDERPYWKIRLYALASLFSFTILVFCASLLIVIGGNALEWMRDHLGFSAVFHSALDLVRWLIVIVFLFLGVSSAYFFSTSRDESYRFASLGTALAVLGFIGACLGLRFYVIHFSSYEVTYGSIGAVMVFMLWLYVLGFTLLVGREVDNSFKWGR